jgi:hypothetical protein
LDDGVADVVEGDACVCVVALVWAGERRGVLPPTRKKERLDE